MARPGDSRLHGESLAGQPVRHIASGLRTDGQGDVSLEGADMYETCVGPATAGGLGLVWHIIAKNTRTTLCGHPLAHTHPPGPVAANTPVELHCAPCMAVFRSMMQAGPQ